MYMYTWHVSPQPQHVYRRKPHTYIYYPLEWSLKVSLKPHSLSISSYYVGYWKPFIGDSTKCFRILIHVHPDTLHKTMSFPPPLRLVPDAEVMYVVSEILSEVPHPQHWQCAVLINHVKLTEAILQHCSIPAERYTDTAALLHKTAVRALCILIHSVWYLLMHSWLVVPTQRIILQASSLDVFSTER